MLQTWRVLFATILSLPFCLTVARADVKEPVPQRPDPRTTTENFDSKPAGKDIDPIAARAVYEKLGAVYGGYVEYQERVVAPLRLEVGKEAWEKGLPGFSFAKAPVDKLPSLNVPFGLSLSGRSITDASLKQLAGLDNLVILGLWGTSVTDAGLKELTA